MQKVLCTLFGSIPNKLTTCFHKRWMRQLLAAEVHRQTKPTFDHTWSVDETMWLRASCFYVKYPAFLHIWFSLQTFNIVIDCKIAMHAQRHTFWAFTSILSCCEDMLQLISHLGSQLGYTCTSTILSITMLSFWITLEQAGFLKIQRVYNKKGDHKGSMAIVLSKST